MTFADIATGTQVFADANVFVYFYGAHPTFGPLCQALLDRAANKEIRACTSTHVLGDVAHRLMTLEAANRTGRTFAKIGSWLKKHPDEVIPLINYRQAIERIVLLGVDVIATTAKSVLIAADFSRQFGVLTNDALVVSLMRENGLAHLASNDADFDRITGLTRYAPA